MRLLLTIVAAAILMSCAKKPVTLDDLMLRDITLPDGQMIHAETMAATTDLLRGMQFRTSLAPDRGMFFVQRRPGLYSYWMYQTLIPLDIVWLDDRGVIVEIVENAPPCKTQASKCPHYGGHHEAQYALELGGGVARKHGLKEGDRLLM